MSLDAGDGARLERIAAQLAATDPALAETFRQWTPSRGQALTGPGWSEVPTWAWMVFLAGFATWMAAPAVGAAVAVAGCCWAARLWARNLLRRSGMPWSVDISGWR